MLRALVVLLMLAAPSVASADDTAARGKETTRGAMHEYFAGEQRGGYILIGMGAAGLLAGGLLYRQGSLTARGASYPLLGIGVLHVAAGIFINISSARRVDKFDAQIDQDHSAFVRDESKRMAGVSTQFTALKIAELVIATGGLHAGRRRLAHRSAAAQGRGSRDRRGDAAHVWLRHLCCSPCA